MLREKQAIESVLKAQGWTTAPGASCAHGTTITAKKGTMVIAVHASCYRSAWLALAKEVEKHTGLIVIQE